MGKRKFGGETDMFPILTVVTVLQVNIYIMPTEFRH